ncbi:MAG TPA: helix-turn-helix domain-containing protein [Candidatus Aminicenantes bacterium]|nr:helix-turn-helix domain-containing protein [Candidatus Aminicenantes bacterium]
MMEDRLLNAPAVAELLTISLRSVWRYAKEGTIPPPIRIGMGTIRWRKSDIDKWLKKKAPE